MQHTSSVRPLRHRTDARMHQVNRRHTTLVSLLDNLRRINVRLTHVHSAHRHNYAWSESALLHWAYNSGVLSAGEWLDASNHINSARRGV